MRSRGDAAVDIGFDGEAEERGRAQAAHDPPVFAEQAQIGDRVESRAVDVDYHPLDLQIRHPRFGRLVERRDHHRLIARLLERPDQSGAEIDDVPRAVRGENHAARRIAHEVQALSSWNRGMATSNAVPSSSTMR